MLEEPNLLVKLMSWIVHINVILFLVLLLSKLSRCATNLLYSIKKYLHFADYVSIGLLVGINYCGFVFGDYFNTSIQRFPARNFLEFFYLTIATASTPWINYFLTPKEKKKRDAH